ncbi:MAG: glycosyltransferase [Alphaproteobacteria bacterium]|nr:glycosyltransferase [Alphaproteobacteria bacterium]
MRIFVIVATKGRPVETARLLDHLDRQSARPELTLVVGAGPEDVEGLADHLAVREGRCGIALSPEAGSSIQRNVALDRLTSMGLLAEEDAMVAFFDDDYRPAEDWLERTRGLFEAHPDIVAITGRMLADGVKGPGLDEAEAEAYLAGARAPLPHWASGEAMREVSAMYGCNMAFRAVVARTCRFDEALPLYGWQEDRDFTQRARAHGRTVYAPGPSGVHMGVKRGRTSGLRFGYSQIANPLYLWRKGTMQAREALRFVARALAANAARSLTRNALFDYRGRLAGNVRALGDLLLGRCDPRRIVDL